MKHKAIMIMVLMLRTASIAQIPDPNDPGNQSTNTTPSTGIFIPQQPQNGAIKTATMTGDVIEWWNFSNHGFYVEWRASLTDGSWVNVGGGYNTFKHQYPEGFYRVIERDDQAVFKVWNSGTTNMIWSATTDSPWLDIACANTNLPPEWGDGYVIATLNAIPPDGSEGIVTIFSGTQTQQCTIVIN